ncbi:SusC/RagA family TonB-linked outer membrane protein [Bacteroides xylanisolvens]|uniref:SusC/RagA family TonB-linked outer membrane protein n=1 Tax=Bacteroides xylanisolvens TaxID=371601 RepID=UPI001C03A115|nr:TonB-dependent receptor [Bacteroides xylanisolvens]MBT9892967.1 SusC/RagA family TonB-linked outer membrane protein [Bacteroides xylanisolvens]
MRKSILLFVLFTLTSIPLLLFAQGGYQVTGHIISAEDNQPMIGVSVLEKGTTNGVITDMNGNYSITVTKSPAILQFSYIGMKTMEKQVSAATRMNLKMESDAQMVEEVVVVAYGVRKKGTIAGSVSTVKAEKMEDVPAPSFDQALQGQAPGLMVLSESGEPSKAATFRIRGTNSINSGKDPLFILDGVAISSSDFNTISPNDIESISVLKDASSTSIYGARASNGVVVITSKRGRMGEAAKITFRTQLGFSQLASKDWDQMDTNERIQFEKEVGLDKGQDYEKLSKININWLDKVYKAPLQNYELSVNGGTEKLNYYVSGSYYDQDGIAVGSTFERVNFRANVEAKANKWLKIGTNTMFTYQEVEQSDDGEYALWAPISASFFMLPYWNPYKEDGSLALQDDGSWKGTTENPLAWMENNPLSNKKYKLLSTFYAEATPIKNLTIRSQLSADYGHTTSFYRSFPSYKPNNNYGGAQRSSYDMLNLMITNTANYRFMLNDVHLFNFMVGQEGVDYHYEGFQVTTRGQTNDILTNLSSGSTASSWGDPVTEYSFLSFFGRGEYNYDDRYYADFSVRGDGSSRFGTDKHWGAFWSVGFMWNLRKEKFMQKYKWLTNAQIAINTGTSGNSSINNYEHLALVSGGYKYNNESGIAISQLGNEELSWESTWATNVALHLGFIDRINLDVEFYNKKTTNMLMAVPISYTTSGFGTRWDNVGAMRNRGVEINVSADVLRIKDFTWNVNANVSYNKNEITELYNGITEYVASDTGRMVAVGHPLGEFYLNRYAGVNPTNGDALWYTKDGEITTEYNENDKVMLGKTHEAPWQGGFGTTLSWQGFSLSAQFTWVADRWMLNNDRVFQESNGLFSAYNQSKRMLYDRWKKPGDVTDIPRYGVTPQLDSRFLEDASFLRLKNLMLSYTFPQKWLQRTNFLSSARIYAQGQNLLTFTSFIGMDPESTSNVYKAQYPMSRQFTFGLEVSF